MIKTLALNEAIAEVFGININEVPEFHSYKPVKQARGWLDSEKIDYSYERNTLGNGVVVFSIGAGSAQYTVVNDNAEEMKGAQIYATLSPKVKSKSQQRRENAMKSDDVESAPVVENAPEDQSEPQTTVTEEKPRKTSRKAK